MPAGRPIYRRRPNTFRLLEVMADGRAYTRFILRQRTGMKHSSVSPALQRLYRRGWLRKHLNPLFNQSQPEDVWRAAGQASCRFTYSLNEKGLEAIKRETAERTRLMLA